MVEVQAKDYQEFHCMVDQNTANFYGWSDQPLVMVTLESDIMNVSSWYSPNLVTFKPNTIIQEP